MDGRGAGLQGGRPRGLPPHTAPRTLTATPSVAQPFYPGSRASSVHPPDPASCHWAGMWPPAWPLCFSLCRGSCLPGARRCCWSPRPALQASSRSARTARLLEAQARQRRGVYLTQARGRTALRVGEPGVGGACPPSLPLRAHPASVPPRHGASLPGCSVFRRRYKAPAWGVDRVPLPTAAPRRV